MAFILASHGAKGKTTHYADALAPQDVISSLPGKDTILSRMSLHTKHAGWTCLSPYFRGTTALRAAWRVTPSCHKSEQKFLGEDGGV